MPRVCEFRGIVIWMYRNEAGHLVAHFHATYGEFVASIAFDGTVLEGELPRPQLRAVQAWAAVRQAELAANWDRARAGERLVRIAPLA